MTQDKVKEIFAQLCKDNDWKLFLSKSSLPLNSKNIHYILIDNNDLKKNIRHSYIEEKPLDIEEHLAKFDFLKPEKILLGASKEIEFKVFTHFLQFKPIKDLDIFSLNEQSFNKWHDFIYNFERVKSAPEDIKTFLTHRESPRHKWRGFFFMNTTHRIFWGKKFSNDPGFIKLIY